MISMIFSISGCKKIEKAMIFMIFLIFQGPAALPSPPHLDVDRKLKKSRISAISLPFSIFLESKFEKIRNSICLFHSFCNQISNRSWISLHFSFFLQSEIEKIMNSIAFFTLFEIRNRKDHEYHCLFHSFCNQKSKDMNIIPFFTLFGIRNRKDHEHHCLFHSFWNQKPKRTWISLPSSFLLQSEIKKDHEHHYLFHFVGNQKSKRSHPQWYSWSQTFMFVWFGRLREERRAREDQRTTHASFSRHSLFNSYSKLMPNALLVALVLLWWFLMQILYKTNRIPPWRPPTSFSPYFLFNSYTKLMNSLSWSTFAWPLRINGFLSFYEGFL